MSFYPTLLQSSNNLKSYSWFDIKKIENVNCKRTKCVKNITSEGYKTTIININPTDNQKNILKKWFDGHTEMYNVTNSYMKEKIRQYYEELNQDKVLTGIFSYDKKNKKWSFNFKAVRKFLDEQKRIIVKQYNMNVHTVDYAIKHCVDMYNASHALHNGNMKRFCLKNLTFNRRRLKLTLEKQSFNKNYTGFCVKTLGLMKSNISMECCYKQTELQYDTLKKTYKLSVSHKYDKQRKINRFDTKVGIDPGIRTFLTTYSENCSYQIGDKTNQIIDKYIKKKDLMNRIINMKKEERGKKNVRNLRKAKIKYQIKMENLIKDLHNRVARFLAIRYETIILGKLSIKSIVSKKNTYLPRIVKRRLLVLSHHKFRMKLDTMSKKFGTNLVLISECLTSRNCSGCGNTKQKDELGGSKVYRCSKCKLIIDRDINAAINIYSNKPMIDTTK